jgi:hypothetical protein
MQLASSRAQKKDTAHSIELITSVDNLRMNLLVKIGNLFSYSRAAIGDQYRIVTQKAKPLKKQPKDS